MSILPTDSPELLAHADALFAAGKLEEARSAFAHLLAATDDPSLRTEAAAMIARTFIAADQLADARPWLTRAGGSASPEQPSGFSRYLSVRGRLEWKEGRCADAQATFRELHAFAHRHHFPGRAVDALRMLGIVSPPEEQLTWTRQAVDEAEAAGLQQMLASLWNNLGAACEDLGRLPEAREAYLKARDYHRQFSPPLHQLKADWAVGHVQRLLGDLIEARRLMTLLLPAFEELDNDEFFGWACHELALIELVEGNRQYALDHFLRARSHLTDAGIASWSPETLNKINAHIAALQAFAIP